ncbi:hypothetical protein U1701_03500 [Sphingomonas sp. PB2P19]|uniref:hypothetical protein n=1 Tax=Sphingomonas rhamnosi TaxID=3096156 RepID=UPI002FC5DA45
MKMVMAIALIISPGIACASAQDVAKPDEKPAKEKKICRSLTPTGSFMATRVCNTAAAWRAFDGETAAGADQTRSVYRMTSAGTLLDKH